MREINLENYPVKTRRLVEGELVIAEEPYVVKEAIISLLFLKDQKIKPSETIRRGRLADKIEACVEPTILVEEDEWNKLREGIESLQDLSRNDIPFIRRVLEAKSVDVKKDDKVG